MKQLFLVLAATLLVACQAAPIPATPNEVASNWMAATDGVVALVKASTDSYCSGVWYRNEIITAHHCVDGKSEGFYAAKKDYTYEGNRFTAIYPFEVKRTAPEADLALLEPIGAALPEHINLRLSKTQPYTGQHVFAIGHPYGWGYTVSEGRVVAPTRTETGLPAPYRWTQSSAEIRPGMSGGPLLTEDAEILGINCFYARASELGAHAHILDIRTLLEED